MIVIIVVTLAIYGDDTGMWFALKYSQTNIWLAW